MTALKSNLIVNYIPSTVTEDDFRTMFEPFGAMTNCKLIKGMGYGFVKYETDAEANAALQALNGKEMSDKRLKVSIARPEGQGAVSDKKTIYVAGLPKTYTEEDVLKVFNEYGVVDEHRLFYHNNTGASKGVAFVRMSSVPDAQKAIQTLNTKLLDGSNLPLILKEWTPKKQLTERIQGSHYDNRNAYYGPQTFAYAQPRYNPMYAGGRSQMHNPPLQHTYAQYPQQFDIYGYPTHNPYTHNPYQPQYAYPAPYSPTPHMNSHSSSVSLFVFHLPPDATESMLKDLFSQFATNGTLESSKVVVDKATGAGKGFGFVNFSHRIDAQTAIDVMNGYQLRNKYLKVSFKK